MREINYREGWRGYLFQERFARYREASLPCLRSLPAGDFEPIQVSRPRSDLDDDADSLGGNPGRSGNSLFAGRNHCSQVRRLADGFSRT
jgi:hypothetical protein